MSGHSLCLYLLGSFRMERDGQLIRLPTRKTESLLAYLALHPEEHSREKIATLFWGDSSDEHSRRSLRTALTTLRHELGVELLRADRDTVRLDPLNTLWIDALEFERQAREFLATEHGAMHVHREWYQGDLLAGFGDEWIPSERERMRALYLDVLLRLTQRLREQGEYSDAIESARQVLATDAANEQAHQHLMWCYLSLGERDAALKQYAECRRALREELAVEPAPETEALYQRIKHATERKPGLETATTNLPNPLTSFIGRTRELASVKQLLATARLLTLTGVGGCGKTRLAIRVATDLLHQFGDGVWWVELAAMSDASLLPHVVRKVLGLSETPGIAVPDLLISHLRSKRLLLVLDNCEHLVAACAQLAETILSHCPDVQILATSRELLGISGEVAWLVPSLSLPIEDVILSSEGLLQWEGIRLFVERAMAAHREFAVTPENMSAIARVCRQVDGMPLAIELAAARTKTLAVEQIAARLDDRFHLLTLGSRTALPRQQTLRMTMDWSHDLLSQPERVLLRRLSVFAGGWTLEAAEAVCAGDGIEQRQVLDLLSHLADKSLLTVEQRNAESRYRLLETIRQYAREKLLEAPEAQRVRDRHLGFYLALAEEAETKLEGAEQAVWFDRLEIELGNLRTASEWALECGASVAGLRLVGALDWFGLLRGYWSEGRERLTVALSQPGAEQQTPARAKALNALGHILWGQGYYAEARAQLEEALAIGRELEDKRSMALSYSQLGRVFSLQGDYTAARSHLEQSQTLSREAGHTFLLGYALNLLGDVALYQGDERAQSLFRESIALFSAMGNKYLLGYALRGLGTVMLRQGQQERAAALYRESLTLNLELRNPRGVAASLGGLAGVALACGQTLAMVRICGAVDALLESAHVQMMGRDPAEYERHVNAARSQLNEATFNTTWEEGHKLTLEQAIAEALAV